MTTSHHLVACFLLGATLSATLSIGEAAAGFPSAAYLPLEAGNTWTFENAFTSETNTVLDTKRRIDGVDTWQLLTTPTGVVEYWTNQNGIRLHGMQIPESPPIDVFFEPPIRYSWATAEIGEQLSSNGTAKFRSGGVQVEIRYEFSTRFEAEERIQVPLGEYDTVRQRSTLRLFGPIGNQRIDETETDVWWLAEQIGPVQFQTTIDNVTTTLSLSDTNLAPATDLAVTQTDIPDPVSPTHKLIYHVQVVNLGPRNATGVALTNTGPDERLAWFQQVTPSQGSCRVEASRQWTCHLGSLPVGATAAVRFEFSAHRLGSAINAARVEANGDDPNPSNNFSEERTRIEAGFISLDELRAAEGAPVRMAAAADGRIALTTRSLTGDILVFTDYDEHQAWNAVALPPFEDSTEVLTGPEIWFDPKDGSLNLAVSTDAALYLFTRDRDGFWRRADLNALSAGADSVPVQGLTHFITPDQVLGPDDRPLYPIPATERNNVHLAGIDAHGELLLHHQFRTRDGAPTEWRFSNLTAEHLIPDQQLIPEWTGDLIAYATPWNGKNIAGIDSLGDIVAVWTAPDREGVWASTNLAELHGAPPLAGGLSAYVNWGINLAGILRDGSLGVTWWSAELENQRRDEGRSDFWAFSDLTFEANGPLLEPESIASYTTPNWPSNGIVGFDASGDLITYWWSPDNAANFGREWAVENLTALLPSRPPATSRVQAASAHDGATSIAGVAANGDLLRYLWSDETGWRLQNVTEEAY